MALWLVANKKADFNGIAAACGISPVTARLIRNRGIIGQEATWRYLHGSLADLHDPFLLHGMDRAVSILTDKIQQHKPIRVIGDYDVDGITSSYILWRLLTFLGGRVSVVLPDRHKDGYGINVRMVEEAIADGVDTILTCDNGIAAMEPLTRAKEAGLTVVLTDHHEIPYREKTGGQAEVVQKEYLLPPADVIIEPKLVNPETGRIWYPFTEICGAVVVYKLAQALLGMPVLQEKPQDDTTGEQHVLRELLAFAAMGTICDVMPLQDENRILVRYGLQEAARTTNEGLRCLIRACGLEGKSLTVYHVGFILGPCLNATGRLDSAERALGLFMEEDHGRCLALAGELIGLNQSRKSMTEAGMKEAEAQLQDDMQQHGLPHPSDAVLILYLPGTNESIAGIVAGRIKEKYSQPVFVLTNSAETGVLKGSGRSIDAYDMYAEINRCGSLLLKYGGHHMAAGLSLKAENLAAFRREMNAACRLTRDQMQETIHIDMELPPRFVTLPLVDELQVLEPCGTGNERPLFVTRGLTLRLTRVLGANRNVLRLAGTDEAGRSFDFILFRKADDVPELCDGARHCCNVVYYPDINEFRGQRSLQFVIRDFRLIPG